MLVQILALTEDVGSFAARVFGRAGIGKPEPFPYDKHNPRLLIDALRDPARAANAIPRMKKLHYGAFYNEETAGRRMGASLAERELMTKGKGFGGLIFGRPMKGLSIGLSHLNFLGTFTAATGLAGGFTAARGHRMSGTIGGVARTLSYALGDIAGSIVGGPALGLAVGAVTEHIGGLVGEGVQMLHDFNRDLKHVNMGGNYDDTQLAYTMRQRAAQELGSSVMNARQYLGREALLMHQ